MSSEGYHEPYEQLSGPARDMHRALTSLVEELEAIDWYAQRAELISDAELRRVLLHNRAEEIEHAVMNLEWIRRNDPKFDATIRTYLLTDVPIVEVEERSQDKPPSETNSGERGLGIGSLKGR
jgi:ferritin-like protein